MANTPSKSAIILGASPDRSRFSNKAIRAYLEAGYEVYPVHPKESRIEGLDVYPDLASVPFRSDLLLLYVRPEIGLASIAEAPRAGVRKVFVNPGTESPELIGRIEELGMEPIAACAIRALGRSPQEFPD
jgi:hypothetical protein